MRDRLQRFLAGPLLVPLFLTVGGSGVDSCASRQDRPPDTRVTVEAELGTPFFLHGMSLAISGRIVNRTTSTIWIVPVDTWNRVRGCEVSVSLKPLGGGHRSILASDPEDFSVEVLPGAVRHFSYQVDAFHALEEQEATVELSILYRQDETLKKAAASVTFAIARYEDLMVQEKERNSSAAPGSSEFADTELRVRVARLRVGDRDHLVSHALIGRADEWKIVATNILGTLAATEDFVLGSMPGFKVLLCYEQRSRIVQVVLSAWTGLPER